MEPRKGIEILICLEGQSKEKRKESSGNAVETSRKDLNLALRKSLVALTLAWKEIRYMVKDGICCRERYVSDYAGQRVNAETDL